MTAKWEIVKELFEHEKSQFVKLSKLTESAVNPKPVERHKVCHCLKVFCDRTVAAIKTHPLLNSDYIEETASFIEEVVKFWKIVSVKEVSRDIRTNDCLKEVISDINDDKLTCLANFGKMVKQMKGKQRKKLDFFTCDTSVAIEHTCNGLIDLCKYLLNNGFNFVMLGEFTTDNLENEIVKLKQGSSSSVYLITVQSIIEKFHIKKLIYLN